MLDISTTKNISTIILRALPQVGAIYLFGSMAKGQNRSDSDVDLALFMQEKPLAETVYQLKSELSTLLNRDIDLIDLLRADTVTQAQVITGSQLLFAKDPRQLAFFETTIFSQYVQLNLERREIVEDIVKRGQIYGR